MTNDPKLEVKGRLYHRPTYNQCPVCTSSANPSYFFVKAHLAGGDVVLECPKCDNTITVSPGMISYNANNSTILGESEKPKYD